MNRPLVSTVHTFPPDTEFQWPLVRMDTVCTLRYGKALTTSNRVDGDVVVYGSNGPTGTHKESLSVGPTAILGRKGQGNLGVEWVDGPFWVIDTAYYVEFQKEVHPKFFYYFVDFVGLNHLKDGTSNPSLSRDTFGIQPFPLPPFEIQDQVAKALSAFDDRIELNRRMNETLESIAQAIFRDWFVDFGPTRRKMDGATDPTAILGSLIPNPEKAAAFAALFPGTLGGDSLPVGWTEKPLDEIATFLNGLALQKYPAEDQEKSLPVIKIAELRNGVTAKSNRASRAVPDKYVIKDGDFLFSWSGSLMAKFWTAGEGALNQHLFKVSSDDYPTWFYTQWVHKHLAEFQQIAASKATTMGHIQRGHLKAAKTVCPSDDSWALMGEILEPIMQKTIQNDLENRTLAATRDLLLPKLMSGEIRLRDVEAPA
ncbi:MAG: restriction endonuclease subunit S [Pseudomonadota bacterium]